MHFARHLFTMSNPVCLLCSSAHNNCSVVPPPPPPLIHPFLSVSKTDFQTSYSIGSEQTSTWNGKLEPNLKVLCKFQVAFGNWQLEPKLSSLVLQLSGVNLWVKIWFSRGGRGRTRVGGATKKREVSRTSWLRKIHHWVLESFVVLSGSLIAAIGQKGFSQVAIIFVAIVVNSGLAVNWHTELLAARCRKI